MSEIEEKARGMGWVPQGEFRGDPEKWRPAEEFVERGENYIPILRDKIKKLETELDVVTKAVKSEVDKAKKERISHYEEKIEALKKQQLEAVQSGDVEKYQELDKKINSASPPKDDEPQVNPDFVEWHKKNSWYATDPQNPGDADRDLTAVANGIASDILAAEPNLPPNKLYDQVEKRVKQLFPDKFKNPNREKADLAEGGGHQPPTTGKKSWADLPKEAKAAYSKAKKRLESKGIDYKKEDYVRDYFEED